MSYEPSAFALTSPRLSTPGNCWSVCSIDLATQISVPQEHIDEGRTLPGRDLGEGRQTIDVRWSSEEPESAFVKVKYRDIWFYIDDRDFRSKTVFTFVMVLFSLTESGDSAGLPLVTIPAS